MHFASRGLCNKGAQCPMAHEELEGARHKRPGASGLGLGKGEGHANMTLSHDNTLNNPDDNDDAINAILTFNDNLTKNKCPNNCSEGGNRSVGSELTLLDPKRNILSIQFSSSDHKVLIGSKQSKSFLTKNKCPVKVSEETSRSGMLTLGKNDPRLENNVLFSLAGGRSDSDMSEKGKSGMDCLTIETCSDGKCEVTVGSGRSQLTLIDPDPNNLEKSKQSQVALLTSLKK